MFNQKISMGKIKYTASFEIKRPVTELFPLFTAEGEKLWVPGWNYENIMDSTELHENYVFLTKNHIHATTEAIWIVKKYDPNEYCVEFYKVEPADKIGVIVVRCILLNESHTKVQVTYEYIGISEKGNQFIQGFSASEYNKFISKWETLLVKYFDGEC
jgi:hypothetical protein